MIERLSCAWCHVLTLASDRYCVACGHVARSRIDCDCARCKAELARTLATIAERRARRQDGAT